MKSNKLIDIIDLDNEVDIISEIIKEIPPELIRQKIKRGNKDERKNKKTFN